MKKHLIVIGMALVLLIVGCLVQLPKVDAATLGDMNGDNKLNSGDVRYLALHIVGNPLYVILHAEGDVNSDGKINVGDVYYLAKYLVGDPLYDPLYPNHPIILSGIGDDVTSHFNLIAGIAIFDMIHDGDSNFIIWLYNVSSGENEELLVNEIGPYSGSRIVGVYDGFSDVKPGEYVLDVTADGNWEVSIEQPTPSTAPSIPQTFTGSGADVPSPFMLESGNGAVNFEMHHVGSSNFIIWLYHISGDREELLVNEIGNYDGSVLVSMGEYGISTGIHYISIEADGNWQVEISYE